MPAPIVDILVARDVAPIQSTVPQSIAPLVLHQAIGAWGLPSLSPFCLKLETYLRMVGLPFQTVIETSPFNGPKKKLPWIEHAGFKLGDSSFIIDYVASLPNGDLGRHLSTSQRALAHAVSRLVDDSLAWVLAYERWTQDSHQTFRNVILGCHARPVRLIITPLALRGMRRMFWAQGVGRHSQEEVVAIGRRDIDALSALLGDKDFLLGEHPVDADASAYGVLANILKTPLGGSLQNAVSQRANLVDFVARIEQRYFA